MARTSFVTPFAVCHTKDWVFTLSLAAVALYKCHIIIVYEQTVVNVESKFLLLFVICELDDHGSNEFIGEDDLFDW